MLSSCLVGCNYKYPMALWECLCCDRGQGEARWQSPSPWAATPCREVSGESPASGCAECCYSPVAVFGEAAPSSSPDAAASEALSCTRKTLIPFCPHRTPYPRRVPALVPGFLFKCPAAKTVTKGKRQRSWHPSGVVISLPWGWLMTVEDLMHLRGKSPLLEGTTTKSKG